MCQILFCWGELCDCDVLAGAGKALGLSWFKIRGGVRHIRVVLSVMSDRVNFGRAAARNSSTLAHIFQLSIGLQSRAAHKSAAPAWW